MDSAENVGRNWDCDLRGSHIYFYSLGNQNMKIYRYSALFLSLAFSISALAYTDKDVENELVKSVKDMSVNLPYETSEVKIYSMVAGPGRLLTYGVIIKKYSATSISSAWKAQRRAMLVNSYCSNPSFKPFWKDSVTVSWHDYDSNGAIVLITDVSPKDCKVR